MVVVTLVAFPDATLGSIGRIYINVYCVRETQIAPCLRRLENLRRQRTTQQVEPPLMRVAIWMMYHLPYSVPPPLRPYTEKQLTMVSCPLTQIPNPPIPPVPPYSCALTRR